MDVTELLAFKPDQTGKRTREEDSLQEEYENKRAADSLPSTAEEILKLVDQEPEAEPVDSSLMKRLLLNLEKRSLTNQQLRIKHADQPRRFLDSELQLHAAIQQLHVLSTAPQLYDLLGQLGGADSLVTLLSHDNSDVVVAVIALLQELLDVESDESAEEDDTEEEPGENGVSPEDAAVMASMSRVQRAAARFSHQLINQQVVGAIVHALERLDEGDADESAGVHSALGVIELLAELSPHSCCTAARNQLLSWLLKRLQLRQPSFDANKLYTAEVLSVLVQNDEQNKGMVGELDGVDVLLRQLSHYKRRDPVSSDEHEYMHNLFGIMCSLLMQSENKQRFLRGEGLQLMNLILREKKQSRPGALKVLNYATAGAHGGDNCCKLVEILGLRTLFPLFMHTPGRNKRKGMSAEEHEEHVVSILAALWRHCRSQQLRARIVNKFVENNLEKVDRLMELHFKYQDKVALTDRQLSAAAAAELSEQQLYLRRLDGGLFTLQLINVIVVEVCAAAVSSGHSPVKHRVTQALGIRNSSLKTVRNTVREYAGNIGDTEESSEAQAEQKRILHLVDKF